MSIHPSDRANLQYAIDAASASAAQGGIPIGAALVFDIEGENLLVATGHNRHLQTGRAAHHAESDAFEILDRVLGTSEEGHHAGEDDERIRRQLHQALASKGLQLEHLYGHLTLYTTMSPCPNCAKQAIERRVGRVVVGDNMTYFGNEQMLVDAGIETITMQTDDCVQLINQFIDTRPDIAQEIGVQKVQL